MASLSSSLSPTSHIGFFSTPTYRAVSISMAGPKTRRPSRSFFSIVAVAEAKKRLYVGNIPRDVTNDQLAKIFAEHASVEKAEVFNYSSYYFVNLVANIAHCYNIIPTSRVVFHFLHFLLSIKLSNCVETENFNLSLPISIILKLFDF